MDWAAVGSPEGVPPVAAAAAAAVADAAFVYDSCEFDKELLRARDWKEEHTANTAITEINFLQ